MTTELELALKIKADLKQAQNSLDRFEKKLLQQERASGKVTKSNKRLSLSFTEIAKSVKRSEQSIGNQITLFRSAAAATGVYIATAKAIQALRTADRFKLIEARLRRVTKAQRDYNKVWAEIVAIANNTGQQIDPTLRLFEGINRAAPEIRATRDEVLTVTRAVQQLGVISGASGIQMANSMLQFSQAMSEGTFRAEEMNSVVTNTPEIAAAIARGMGLTVGQLQKAVRAGKVLSTEVFQSLLTQAPRIAKEMEESTNSMGRAGTTFSTNISRITKEIDRSVGATNAITAFFARMGRGAGRVADYLEEMNRTVDERTAAEQELNRLFEVRLDLLGRLNAVESIESPGLLDKTIMRQLREEIAAVDAQMNRLTETRDRLLQEAADAPPVLGAGGSDEAGGVPETLRKAIEAQGQANNRIKGLVAQRQSLIDELDALTQRLSGPSNDEGQSTSASVLELNRLRGSANTKFERGDLEGGFADLERAKQLIEQLTEADGISAQYLQRQIELVRQLAEESADKEIAVPVTLALDEDAHVRTQQYAQLRAEFEAMQKDFRLSPELDIANGADRLRDHLQNLQAIADANPIRTEVVFTQTGGLGTPINISFGNETIEARSTSPVTPEVTEALQREALKAGA